MIEVQHLSVALQGKTILQDLHFSIPKGRIVMMLGENGAGKTTLIKALLQQISYQGKMYYQQEDVHKKKEKERAAIFSYVPQIKQIMEDLEVRECIVSGCTRNLSIFATPRKQEYEQADAIMERFHLTYLKGKRLQEISGGELQMVYVARAFLQDAQVMLMDEPCTYLDFQHQHAFLQATKTLTQKDKSVLISIHDPNLALQYADEILLLHKGSIYAHLKKEEVNMWEECCRIYNELYGHHFTLTQSAETPFLIWKEN